jgi:hypothetical protein
MREGVVQTLLTLALDGVELLASLLTCFTPKERVLDSHWIEGWMGPRASLNAVTRRKIPASVRNQTPIVQPIA